MGKNTMPDSNFMHLITKKNLKSNGQEKGMNYEGRNLVLGGGQRESDLPQVKKKNRKNHVFLKYIN